MEHEKIENAKEEQKKSCHGGHCGCGIKVIGAIVLILIGWICGYLMGACGKGKSMCSYNAMPGCPMSSASQPPAK